MLPSCQVRSEQTQTIVHHPGQHCDVLVTAIGRSPVVVEAEYEPAPEAELDAGKRLGVGIHGEVRAIEAAIALRYPTTVASAYDLHTALANIQLSYCVLYEDGTRFPASGWLTGSVTDLADLIRLVSVPRKNVDKAVGTLQAGIDSAANVLNQLTQTRPDINPAIGKHLNMADVPQMRRMACSIIANAMLFHERLAGRHGIQLLDQVCGPGISNPRAGILAAWDSILSINYLDIFQIARAIVSELPTQEGSQILNIISFHVLQIAADGVNNDHDLTGQVFQRLIADRKYLATFYTLPASAALLAGLAVAKMKTPSAPADGPMPTTARHEPVEGRPAVGNTDGVVENLDWSDLDAIGNLRIADFACGTGALLSAVAEQITSRYERTGGNVTKVHPILMEQVLYGCDVMPSAVHITGSTLAGLQPSVSFQSSNLTTMPYGRQDDGSVAIGSLELLNPDSPFSQTMPDESFDLVIMNPPFTRAGSDWEGPERPEDAVKQFRGLGNDLETQKAMSQKTKQLAVGTCAHGYAGIASTFVALADRKLKPGGVLALVLPLTSTGGQSWQKFRRMLTVNCTNIQVLSVVSKDDDMSFSSETGMAECLIVARKRLPAETVDDLIIYVSLSERPTGFAQSMAIVGNINKTIRVRRLDDGPYGGTPLTVGEDLEGQMCGAPFPRDGDSLSGVRVADYSVAQFASCLTQSQLWPPGNASPLKLPVVPLGSVSHRGFYHRNIVGAASAPFVKMPPNRTATYPSLWNHDAQREAKMVCSPDCQLIVKPESEGEANKVWATASRVHVNQDFRFNSQPMMVAITEDRSLEGRAWPNILFDDLRFDDVMADWGNSSLGLVSFWWHSNRQVAGRGEITIGSLDHLPILDFRKLSDEQLATAEDIFDDFRERDLLPAYLADADPNRALLDRRVICDLLGFDHDTYRAVRRLAQKWCAEPSVHGGKARPKDATYVE